MIESEAQRQHLEAMINGYRQSAIIGAAVKLGIPDALAGGSMDTSELAEKLKLHGPSLYRLLRGLAVSGLVREESGATFALTPMGRLLCGDSTSGLRELAVIGADEYGQAWGGLAEGVRSGKSAYEAVYGESPWQRRKAHPELENAFNHWLSLRTAAVATAIAEAYDFSRADVIADLAGGQGALLAHLLSVNPQAKGILFEQPHTLEVARAARDLAPGIQCVAGDLLSDIRVNADIYLLKSVLHDWNDDACHKILQNCRQAMKPQSVMLVIERLMPACVTDDPFAVMLDLHMMVVTGGRERTESEFQVLLQAAGFQWRRIIRTKVGFVILEAVPDGPG